MIAPTARVSTAVLSIALLISGCRTHSATLATAPAPAAGGKAEPASHQAQLDSARSRYTEADVRFMSGMIDHHAQALVVAGWAASHGASSSIRTLAGRIINGQQDEIATMQRWLRDRGQPVPEPGAGMKMDMHGAGQDHLMPGMLTAEQMRQLDQAKGPEFDRLFLTFMIQHHRGAVSMVTDLFDTPGAARDEAAFKLANDVSVDQTTEIARMQRMLATLPGERSP
jgi:uncharacterized protein (DUF305 family)